jgi:hypothetical protein
MKKYTNYFKLLTEISFSLIATGGKRGNIYQAIVSKI